MLLPGFSEQTLLSSTTLMQPRSNRAEMLGVATQHDNLSTTYFCDGKLLIAVRHDLVTDFLLSSRH
jgi:hypothetical protein